MNSLTLFSAKEITMIDLSTMTHLLINLLEGLGILTIAFILIMRFDVFKRLLTGKTSRYEKLYLSVFFGVLGIVETYMGVHIQGAIANSRVVSVTLGGILGGPLVGAAAGFIAGGHRYLIDIGGFTAPACALATFLEGLIGGWLYHRLKRRQFDSKMAFYTGIIVEILQMVIILLMAKPFSDAWKLVRLIGLPMTLINSFGLALFVELVASVYRENERFAAFQAQTALKIALRTLPFLRSGLTTASASETARIIVEMTDLDGVSITNETNLLAYKGAEEDHHQPGMLLHDSTKAALTSGNITEARTRGQIGCDHPDCRLGSAIIVPLKKQDKTIGTLQLYRLKENGIKPLDMELVNGLAPLFSYQLEISELDEQRKLAEDAKIKELQAQIKLDEQDRLLKDAEIKILQAQINPHFLFNAINTIISYIRTSPETASDLLVKLADFYRTSINLGRRNVSLETELEHCRAYIAIESARFEERIRVAFHIDEECLSCLVPPLILQPLVENALKHGILRREEGGDVTIAASADAGLVCIAVMDNGEGIEQSQLASLLADDVSDHTKQNGAGTGIALKNVNARLVAIYGAEHALQIESTPEKGTTVSFSVPLTP